MSTFIDKLATKIIESDGYRVACNLLFGSYVSGQIGESREVDRVVVKKLISSAQTLYRSENRRMRDEGAIILSMLLDVCAQKHPDIVPIANSIFSHSGDFPNIQLLSKRHQYLDFEYGFFSKAQMSFRKNLNAVEEIGAVLTDYQRGLWQLLSNGEDIVTSAPTSAGKTHIILNYLVHIVAKSEGAYAAIIVPTRALISEVAGKIYELAKEHGFDDSIDVCTLPRDENFGNKTFFVMTQERLHELLIRGDIFFNYLFIDEAHNIADKSRGVLLHLTIEKMLESNFPQVIISMPSESYRNSFSSIFKDVVFTQKITRHSPVSKIVMSVTPKGRDLVITRHNSNDSTKLAKGFAGKRLADIVYKIGKGQSNIIYRNRTDYCEEFADDIAALIPEQDGNPLLEEAADYVEKFVHDDFSLAENLRKGVAFHYGPLPSSVRVMIENLAKQDHIRFIACTSTLAEGVNLPAKNLFLRNPCQPVRLQPSERIENVKINNITGRAGRMLQHFSGNIYLIEPEIWQFKDYFDERPEEDKIPTYFKSINEEFNQVNEALKGTYSHGESDQYRFYTIANKLIKAYADDSLNHTLKSKELTLNSRQKAQLTSNIQAAHDSLLVAAFTLEANPTVGYIQQNNLFKFIDGLDSLEGWTLPYPWEPEVYHTLIKVCDVMNQCGVYIPTEDNSIEHICTIATKWVRGNSLKEIISEQIKWDAEYAKRKAKNPSSPNACVRNVIKAIDSDIRFRLANALRCYQTLVDNALISRELDIPNAKMHSFIEVGAYHERMINLINLGLSREASKEIHSNLLASYQINSLRDLQKLRAAGLLSQVHTITQKEIDGLFT